MDNMMWMVFMLIIIIYYINRTRGGHRNIYHNCLIHPMKRYYCNTC